MVNSDKASRRVWFTVLGYCRSRSIRCQFVCAVFAVVALNALYFFHFMQGSCPPMVGVVLPPSQGPRMLHNATRTSYSQFGQDLTLWPILKNIRDGFYVESGAGNGEINSNSLFYELHGWSGLLVEPDPLNAAAIRSLSRNAYFFHGCLSPSGRTEEALMQKSFNWEVGSLYRYSFRDTFKKVNTYSVVAISINSLMTAIGRHTIDFWSLDIEGSEGAVLETTDFARLEIGVLLIEMDKATENNNRVNQVMAQNGFNRIGFTWDSYNKQRLDGVFVNPRYFEARGVQVPTHI